MIPMALTPILKKPGRSSSASDLKVAFAIPAVDDIDVEEALKEGVSKDGPGSRYAALLNALKSPETEDSSLIRLLKRIRSNIQLIENHSDDVPATILKIDVLKRGTEVLDAFSKLVLDLVSLHPVYLRHVVRTVLRIFMSPDAFSNEVQVADREEKLEQLHNIVREIVRLVPLSPTSIVSVVADTFPYLKHDGRAQASLVRHLLVLVTYLPSQRIELLQLVVHKALQLDLHAPKEDIEDYEDVEEEEGEVFAMDTDVGEKQKSDDPELKHPLANSLDLILEQLYLFLNRQCGLKGSCADGKVGDWEKTKAVFKDFLTVFDRVILPTYKCCHVQFVMFYLSSLRPALLEAFLDYLWKKVQNPNTAPVVRQVASFYIGSLLARGKFVPLSTVQDCLALLCKWAHLYVGSLGGGGTEPDVKRHGTFYAVCQTVLYIFAFHHKDLTTTAKGLQFLRGLNLEALVMSPLNPLRVCLPTVVQRFANVARHYQLVYCYTLLERNRRNQIPVADDDEAQAGRLTPLECFFPFDPYLLLRTGKYIQPLYRHFERSPDEANADEEMEDEDESAPEDNIKSSSAASSVAEMFSYGTSPGFKKFHTGALR